MSDIQLGKLVVGDQERDAIHIAVIPVKAGCDLRPGERVDLASNGLAYPQSSGLGIVDPFLECGPDRGDTFWLVLMPNSIVGMRHHWKHPRFDGEPKPKPTKEESEAWLRNYIAHADCPEYEVVIAAAAGEYVEDVSGYGRAYDCDDEYLFFNGRDAHGDIPLEFWDHVENVTGKKCDVRPHSWSCSC